MKLFEHCPICSHGCTVKIHVIGTFISVTQACKSCEFQRCWVSQPIIGSMPAGNIHFLQCLLHQSRACHGCSECRRHRSSTYYRHMDQYLQPTILTSCKTKYVEGREPQTRRETRWMANLHYETQNSGPHFNRQSFNKDVRKPAAFTQQNEW